ncbi:MAG TPA: hypothetical protein VKT52_12220, partial [Ktedonobacterales bacterium]|nr:hypothetical protein [Ktedonobacterales bacterium]
MATSEAAFPQAGPKTAGARKSPKPPKPAKSSTTRPRTSSKTRPVSTPVSLSSAEDDLTEARATIVRLRDEASERARPAVKAGAAPIRVMAGMVKTLEADLRARNIPANLIATEVVNRTIGDVDLRRVSPEDDGPEYVSLADDMGLALPGEVIGGRVS